MTDRPTISERWRGRRDAKLAPVLPKDDPVWLFEESSDTAKEMMIFSIITRWEEGGQWLRRRYTYDPVGDVLHFRGERPVTPEERTKLKPDTQYRNTYSS